MAVFVDTKLESTYDVCVERAKPEDLMKLACFTMFRNEAAILPAFLDQIETFFDHAVMLNHESRDNGPAYVRSRGGTKIELFHLKAPGYPQSAVATRFARHIMSRHDPDFLFLLDCDEFLPFANRSELEKFLSGREKHDAILLHWLNVCPTNLNGGNIFAAPFWRAPRMSDDMGKVIMTRRAGGRPDLTITQGYHWVNSSSGTPVDIQSKTDKPVYHIPVLSRPQFYFKIGLGAANLRREQVNLRHNRGWHWIDLDQELASNQLSDERLTGIALTYSELPKDAPASPMHLDFTFPYIHSPYCETPESQAGQIRGLLQFISRPEAQEDPEGFTVIDEAGEILFSSGGQITTPGTKVPCPALPSSLLSGEFAENYAALIEPLFCLPAKLAPASGWIGHMPFLFVLFRALQPETYVELGVQKGASLIAAASAAATYHPSTRLVGVDSWQGDEHTGFYDGDQVYPELHKYLADAFPRVRLERGFFADILPKFAAGSIDLLHIDGLHTYEAVKQDFVSWFDRVSSSGVIIFHDISVHDRGFGVYRLWDELKEHFATLEFHHSFGLGVLLLNPELERLKPLVALARNPEAMRAYQALVADVARVLPERMNESTEGVRARPNPSAQRELAALYKSTSWRITAPMRRIGRMLGR